MTTDHLLPGLCVLFGAIFTAIPIPGLPVVGWFTLGIGVVCGASFPFTWQD